METSNCLFITIAVNLILCENVSGPLEEMRKLAVISQSTAGSIAEAMRRLIDGVRGLRPWSVPREYLIINFFSCNPQ